MKKRSKLICSTLGLWRILALVFAGLFTGLSYSQQSSIRLQFVHEFVRELEAMEDIRSMADRDLKEKGANVFIVGIGTSTRTQLELKSSINRLDTFQLPSNLSDVPEILKNIYRQKIDLHENLITIASNFTGAPKQGVDYDAFTTEMPKVRARLDFIDKTIFQATNLIFATLINMEPEKESNASNLIITKAEKLQLINRINKSFGTKMTAKNSISTYADCAWLLKTQLLKFKGSDEAR